MGVKVQWDNSDKTIIQMIYEGRWQWDDVRAAVVELNQMIDSVDNNVVHVISNRGSASWTPGNYATNLQEIIQLLHPRAGYRVFIVKNPVAREMFYIFSGMTGGIPFPYRFVNTLDEAREFLARYILGGSYGE
ncbi:MAG: hypothetical protein ABI690_30200 [Chloroflexota bacterium]